MKRVFLWILGGATVLAVAAAVLLSRVDAGFVVRQIADATAKATGHPLTFDSPPGIPFFPPASILDRRPGAAPAMGRAWSSPSKAAWPNWS